LEGGVVVKDPRARYFRRLNKLRRSARHRSVWAGILVGAAAVLVPYHGIGLFDAFWAAAAGGTAVAAAWRWRDARELAAQPAPPELDPAMAGALARQRLVGVIERLPAGKGAIEELRRQRTSLALRGSAVRPLWVRLDRASVTLAGFAGRLGGVAESAVLEAAVAERSLRDLAERTASVEKGLRLATGEAQEALAEAHGALLAELEAGVGAYEQLVAAAAGYVAEDGRTSVEGPAVNRLSEATDMLRAFARGLSEVRTIVSPPSPSI
jgi:hypothetical protein